jgi:hypothetical protein
MAHTGRKPDVESLAVCLFVLLGLHITLTRLCIFSRIPGGSLETALFDGMVSGQPCHRGTPQWTLNSQYSILEHASKSSILAIFNTLDFYTLRTRKRDTHQISNVFTFWTGRFTNFVTIHVLLLARYSTHLTLVPCA